MRNPFYKKLMLSRCFLILFCSTSFSLCFAEITTLFSTSDNCSTCHSSDSTALIDSQGNDLSIYHDWGSTMMANAFHDPLFRAKVSSEGIRNTHLKEVIEDKCTTCHTPMGRTQAHWDGSLYYSITDAESSGISLQYLHIL